MLHAQRSHDFEVYLKADGTQVTTTDRAINNLLITEVRDCFPEHGVLGEEASWHSEADVLWIVDPIDGTRYFIGETSRNNKEYSFSLALSIGGKAVFGVVLAPALDEPLLYVGEVGKPTTRNGQLVRVNKDNLYLETFFGAMTWRNADPNLGYISSDQFPGCKHQVHMGSIALQFCRVADGTLGFSAFPGHGAHDIAAGKLIVEQAGGEVTDLRGEPIILSPTGNFGALASNGRLHKGVIQEVANHCLSSAA